MAPRCYGSRVLVAWLFLVLGLVGRRQAHGPEQLRSWTRPGRGDSELASELPTI